MNYDEIVKSLRETPNHKKMCIDEKNFLYKCILCKKFLSATEWGPLMEKYIKELFLLKNTIKKDEGDGITQNLVHKIEIKVSLGDSKGKFNFVQLRPDHKLDYYLIVCYNLFEDKYGKIYIFLCKPDDLYELIPEYGAYAHGNIKALGNITKDSLKGRSLEYCLRPNPINSKSKQKKLWDLMIKKFLFTENDVHLAFGNIKSTVKDIDQKTINNKIINKKKLIL